MDRTRRVGYLLGSDRPWRHVVRRSPRLKHQRPPEKECFMLTDSAMLVIQMGDITLWEGDAIVNAANELMLGGGGVDGAIHRRAGPGLLQECRACEEVVPGVRCPVGEARITAGHRLPVDYVIHTVGPIYRSAARSEPLLRKAFKSSLVLANGVGKGLKTIAFPAISCGIYGYPLRKAAEVSLTAAREHVGSLEEVHFVLFDRETWDAFLECAKSRFKRPPSPPDAPDPPCKRLRLDEGEGESGEGDAKEDGSNREEEKRRSGEKDDRKRDDGKERGGTWNLTAAEEDGKKIDGKEGNRRKSDGKGNLTAIGEDGRTSDEKEDGGGARDGKGNLTVAKKDEKRRDEREDGGEERCGEGALKGVEKEGGKEGEGTVGTSEAVQGVAGRGEEAGNAQADAETSPRRASESRDCRASDDGGEAAGDVLVPARRASSPGKATGGRDSATKGVDEGATMDASKARVAAVASKSGPFRGFHCWRR